MLKNDVSKSLIILLHLLPLKNMNGVESVRRKGGYTKVWRVTRLEGRSKPVLRFGALRKDK